MIRIFVWLCAALLVSTTSASGQTQYFTAEITFGTFNADLSSGIVAASYDMSGPGVHFVAVGVDYGVIDGAGLCARSPGCPSGEVLTLNATFMGFFGAGMAVVGGQTINPAYFAGHMRFVTGELTIPRGNRKHLVLRTRFTALADEPGGGLKIYIDNREERPVDVGIELSGSGTATAFFVRKRLKANGGPPRFLYHLARVIYSFDTAAPP